MPISGSFSLFIVMKYSNFNKFTNGVNQPSPRQWNEMSIWSNFSYRVIFLQLLLKKPCGRRLGYKLRQNGRPVLFPQMLILSPILHVFVDSLDGFLDVIVEGQHGLYYLRAPSPIQSANL